MAFRSNKPIALMFPPFRGVTRRIILLALVVYFGTAALRLVSEQFQGLMLNFFRLHASEALHPQIWQLVTYPFVQDAFLSVAHFAAFVVVLRDGAGRRSRFAVAARVFPGNDGGRRDRCGGAEPGGGRPHSRAGTGRGGGGAVAVPAGGDGGVWQVPCRGAGAV